MQMSSFIFIHLLCINTDINIAAIADNLGAFSTHTFVAMVQYDGEQYNAQTVRDTPSASGDKRKGAAGDEAEHRSEESPHSSTGLDNENRQKVELSKSTGSVIQDMSVFMQHIRNTNSNFQLDMAGVKRDMGGAVKTGVGEVNTELGCQIQEMQGLIEELQHIKSRVDKVETDKTRAWQTKHDDEASEMSTTDSLRTNTTSPLKPRAFAYQARLEFVLGGFTADYHGGLVLPNEAKGLFDAGYPNAVKYVYAYSASAGSTLVVVKWRQTDKMRDVLDAWDAGQVLFFESELCPKPWATLIRTPMERRRGQCVSVAVIVLKQVIVAFGAT